MGGIEHEQHEGLHRIDEAIGQRRYRETGPEQDGALDRRHHALATETLKRQANENGGNQRDQKAMQHAGGHVFIGFEQLGIGEALQPNP